VLLLTLCCRCHVGLGLTPGDVLWTSQQQQQQLCYSNNSIYRASHRGNHRPVWWVGIAKCTCLYAKTGADLDFRVCPIHLEWEPEVERRRRRGGCAPPQIMFVFLMSKW